MPAQSPGVKAIFLLPIAGLLSALLSMCFVGLIGRPGVDLLVAGVIYGAALAGCLAILRVLRSPWKAVQLTLVTTAALFVGWLITVAVELALAPVLPRDQVWSMSHGEVGSLIALFAGGLVGGLLVPGDALLLARRELGLKAILLSAVLLSILGGALASLGWMLGPSLGAALWKLFDALHLAGPAYVPRFDLYEFGEAQRAYSLFVVWQTGMAAAIAILLFHHNPQSHPKE